MKSFLKKAAIAAVAGAMVFGLAGCGGEKKEAAGSKNPKEVTIYMGAVSYTHLTLPTTPYV